MNLYFLKISRFFINLPDINSLLINNSNMSIKIFTLNLSSFCIIYNLLKHTVIYILLILKFEARTENLIRIITTFCIISNYLITYFTLFTYFDFYSIKWNSLQMHRFRYCICQKSLNNILHVSFIKFNSCTQSIKNFPFSYIKWVLNRV